MNHAWKILLAATLVLPFAQAVDATDLGCASSAELLYAACGFDASDDFFTSKAHCLDSSEVLETCMEDAVLAQDETLEECDDVFAARLDLCDALDDAPHEPAFGPELAPSFVDPLEIGTTVTPHTYFPLVSGNRWVYEGTFLDDDDGEVTETITVIVTDKVKLIEGITCIVVNDVVEEDGVVIENTGTGRRRQRLVLRRDRRQLRDLRRR
ncbi:MAG: hypothetical protein P8Y95_16970 [Gammaproteobacteria bacterium]